MPDSRVTEQFSQQFQTLIRPWRKELSGQQIQRLLHHLVTEYEQEQRRELEEDAS